MIAYKHIISKVHFGPILIVGMLLITIVIGNASVLISEDKIWEYSNSEEHQDSNRRLTRYKFSGYEIVAGKKYRRLLRIYECGFARIPGGGWNYEPYETYEKNVWR